MSDDLDRLTYVAFFLRSVFIGSQKLCGKNVNLLQSFKIKKFILAKLKQNHSLLAQRIHNFIKQRLNKRSNRLIEDTISYLATSVVENDTNHQSIKNFVASISSWLKLDQNSEPETQIIDSDMSAELENQLSDPKRFKLEDNVLATLKSIQAISVN